MTGADPEPKPGATSRDHLRETYRAQLLTGIGGWTGTVITAIPPVVFVIVNATSGLRPAIIAALATGVALAVYRLVRKQSTQQAISGLFGVLIAAIIAARTGQARGYFLLGIWSSFAYAVPFAISVLVRRPIVGWLWEFLDPAPDDPAGRPWYRRRVLLRAYTIATLIGTVVFLARGIVQALLYHQNATGWLAFARVAMGYPLYIAGVALAFLVVRRARHSISPPADAPTPADSPVSADDSSTDRGLGLG
jgi:FtsH-binding integral membrane protein